MTHREALEFLTRIGAVHEGDIWTLTVGTASVSIICDDAFRPEWRWLASPDSDEVSPISAADPQQALLDLGAELSTMATHCSSFGLALTRLAL